MKKKKPTIFSAQLGSIDTDGDVSGKDNKKGPACYTQNFKNGSKVLMPAPNWMQDAKSQAGLTLNVVGIDEWTKVESMTRKTNSRFTSADGTAVGGINQQIIGRVRRSCFNQHHPLWGNHRLFMATAESTLHAGYPRYQIFQAEIAKGNPNYAAISFSFKDFSNLKSHTGKPFKEQVPDWKTIKTMKAQFTRAHFLREVLGMWARETQGLYSEAALDRCVASGMANKLEPECVRGIVVPGEMVYYFLGVDPAPALRKTADDGALAVLRVRPKPGLGRTPTGNVGDWLAEFVWAYRIRGDKLRSLRTATTEDSVFIAETTREWSGHIHRKHRHFGFTGICMDPQGGGQHIMTELNKTRQTIEGVETEVTPIASLDDQNIVYVLSNNTPSLLSSWAAWLYPVASVNGAIPSATVTASGDVDTAYALALQRAQTLGANKESTLGANAFLRSSQISWDQRRVQSGTSPEFVRLAFAYEYQGKLAAGRAYVEMSSATTLDTFGTDTQTVSGFVAATDFATAQQIYQAQVRSAYKTALIHNETVTQSQALAQAGQNFPAQFLKLDFNFQLYQTKPTGRVAYRYGINVRRDFLTLKLETHIKGSIFAFNRVAANAALTNLLQGLSGSQVLEELNEDREYMSDLASSSTSDVFLKLDFDETFENRLTGITRVLEMSLSQQIKYSGTRWIPQPLPFDANGSGGYTIVQPGGIQEGGQTIRGSVTAPDQATAIAWAKTQRGLLTGNCPQPEEWDWDYEFVPRIQGVVKGPNPNVRLYKLTFTFAEILPNYPPPA